MRLSEIGQAVRARREALGLTQLRLGKFADLSRVTINQLENGTLSDLGVVKLVSLLELLNLTLNATPGHQKTRGLRMASRTASVSYRKALDIKTLVQALTTGTVPSGYEAHLCTLIDEGPLSVIIQTVEGVARQSQVPARQIWRHLMNFATKYASPRRAWN